jgi:hypothetical protein
MGKALVVLLRHRRPTLHATLTLAALALAHWGHALYPAVSTLYPTGIAEATLALATLAANATLGLALSWAALAAALALSLRWAALGWGGQCYRDEHGEAGGAEGKKGATNHGPAPESVGRLETAV